MTEVVADSEQKRSILVVHGRGYKPPADEYLALVKAALRAGIERDHPDNVRDFDRIDVHLAWYGDLAATVLDQRGGAYDPALDIGDRQNALQALGQITPRKKFSIRAYDCLPGKSAVPEFLAGVLSPVLGTLGLFMPAMRRLAPDFAAYLDNSGKLADQVRGRVRAQLCELVKRGDHVMLMTHGTGSVIAYDTLWELTHDPEIQASLGGCKIDQWVTLGAPLGNRNVQKRLRGAGEEGANRFPGNVITWHNLAAEDDYACHDGTLADDFRKMMSERLVSAVRDFKIYNLAVRYGKSNPHSSVGYFIHPRVAQIIADWLA